MREAHDMQGGWWAGEIEDLELAASKENVGSMLGFVDHYRPLVRFRLCFVGVDIQA